MGKEKYKKLPKSVGIIPDHNRTWHRRLGRFLGYSLADTYMLGAERMHAVAREAQRLGIEHLAVFGFSCENQNGRTEEELDSLLAGALYFCERLDEMGCRVHPFGELEALRGIEKFKPLYRWFDYFQAKEWPDVHFTVHVAAHYSGLAEHELQPLIKKLWAADSNEALVLEDPMRHLLSAGVPNMDLIIRTGNVHRLSGFLPFQAAYTELRFERAPWPRFTTRRFRKALRWYGDQTQNHGK